MEKQPIVFFCSTAYKMEAESKSTTTHPFQPIIHLHLLILMRTLGLRSVTFTMFCYILHSSLWVGIKRFTTFYHLEHETARELAREIS